MKFIASCLVFILLWLTFSCRSEQAVFPIGKVMPPPRVTAAHLPIKGPLHVAASPKMLGRQLLHETPKTSLALLRRQALKRPLIIPYSRPATLRKNPSAFVRLVRQPQNSLASVQDGNVGGVFLVMVTGLASLLLLLIGAAVSSWTVVIIGLIGLIVSLILLSSDSFKG
jgi:hypothetical protein